RISFSGPSVALQPQAALHLALILHELGTNARKYGSLSVQKGRLLITWAVRTSGGRELLLQWQESGGPAVKAPSSRGFGTTLIEKSLAAQKGDACIHYLADGITCDIRLPLRDDAVAHAVAGMMLTHTRVSPVLPAQSATSAVVRGRRILVVEDEPLIAMDICATLSEAGCEVVGPSANVGTAIELIAAANFDAALLDANLGGHPVVDLAAALTRRNIPFAFLTGYGREGLPDAFRHPPMIGKPFMPEHAFKVIAQLLQRDGEIVPLRQKTV